jgi:hypothetical protein
MLAAALLALRYAFEFNKTSLNVKKIEMAAKTAKKARKSSLSAAGQVMGSEDCESRAERIQDTPALEQQRR